MLHYVGYSILVNHSLLVVSIILNKHPLTLEIIFLGKEDK